MAQWQRILTAPSEAGVWQLLWTTHNSCDSSSGHSVPSFAFADIFPQFTYSCTLTPIYANTESVKNKYLLFLFLLLLSFKEPGFLGRGLGSNWSDLVCWGDKKSHRLPGYMYLTPLSGRSGRLGSQTPREQCLHCFSKGRTVVSCVLPDSRQGQVWPFLLLKHTSVSYPCFLFLPIGLSGFWFCSSLLKMSSKLLCL